MLENAHRANVAPHVQKSVVTRTVSPRKVALEVEAGQVSVRRRRVRVSPAVAVARGVAVAVRAREVATQAKRVVKLRAQTPVCRRGRVVWSVR